MPNMLLYKAFDKLPSVLSFIIAFAFILDKKKINMCVHTYSVHDVGMKMLQPKLCVHLSRQARLTEYIDFWRPFRKQNHRGMYWTYSLLACRSINMYTFVLYTNEYIFSSCIISSLKTNSIEILKSVLCCIKVTEVYKTKYSI